MEHSKQPFLKRLLSVRGMGAALTAFAGLIIIYIAFGLINPTVFSGRNIVNLTRSMSKYLIIGIGQSYLLITGNIDLSIGSVVGMSAMISGTLMSGGMHPVPAILITLVACLLVGVLNGMLVGKFQLPPFIATLGTMFVARGVAYMGQRQPQHQRHRQRHRPGDGRQVPKLLLLWRYAGPVQHLLDCHVLLRPSSSC